MGTPINKMKLTSVQIIQSQNDLVLVQWTDDDGILRRNWVEASQLTNLQGRRAEVKNPNEGILYGVEFWRLIKLKASPKDFDRELKQRGIWTIADMRSRPNEVVGALVATYGVDLAAVLLAADRYEKELSGD